MRLATALLALTLVPGLVQAQITLTEATLQGQLLGRLTATSFEAENPGALQALAGVTGGGQTFDMRAAQFGEGTSSAAERVACSASVPGCTNPAFAQANVVLRTEVGAADSVAVLFARLEPSGLSVLGFVAEFEDEGEQQKAELVYSPALLDVRLPLTAGTTWETDVTATFNVGGFPFVSRERTQNVVDGWGTLVTPAGSAAALRHRARTLRETEVFGFVVRDTTVTVTFRTSGALEATLVMDDAGQVQSAGYTVTLGASSAEPEGVPGLARLDAPYPNPARERTDVRYTIAAPAQVHLALYDVLGREVATLDRGLRGAGTYTAEAETGALPAGVYVLRLAAGGETRMRTFTVQR